MSRIEVENVLTKREVHGLRVPSGEDVAVPQGAMVQITQALGNAYTINYNGNLVRIDGSDADALGKEASSLTFAGGNGDRINEEDVWEAMKSVYDPEIPVNIVELGLIYDCRIEDHNVYVKMTLTAPGCGMGPVLVHEVQNKLLSVPNVEDAKVELTFDPPWDSSNLSDVAKLQLGLL